ncbi:aminotransferase class I/II-fold pyridoxal phosphate-dependent enzyme [Alphaproteobacteria bacterium]|nr:aminotransferase class I/II-fold pyridoxal phosphate-dependent enzyme [Alphaproteobacteria bacterium]
MPLKVSARGQIEPFMVMDVLYAANQRASSGEVVYHLEIGQPGTGVPRDIIDAIQEPLFSQKLGYTDAFGITPLRDAIVRHYQSSYGLTIDQNHVAVTNGSSASFVVAFLAAFDVGDRVAVASPGYPCYRHMLKAFGIEPVILETEFEDRFQPTPEKLKALLPLDGLIVASPSNPTGTMLDARALKVLSDFCREHDIRLISDEIYHGITYEQSAVSALEFNPDAIIINSFSKYFSMTGWRVGWMLAPEELLRPMECLQQNLFICAPAPSQIAALAAFDFKTTFDGYVARYRQNRDLLLNRLPSIGFDKLAPADGAFYLYADVSSLTNDSEGFCRKILAQTGVAFAPGLDFDSTRGKKFIRISYAESPETINQAVDVIAEWMSANR